MKKSVAVLLILAMSLTVLAGCGSKENKEADKTKELTKITVGASTTPHAEILNALKGTLAKEGYDLVVQEFTDYVLPNTALNDGSLDANYFQHQPYLDDFNKEHKMDLKSVAAVHYEPFGIYPGQKKALNELASGDIIAVPNDTTNEARALLLLQDNGLITLADGVDITATVNDIKENKNNIKFVELEAAQIARVLPEVSFAVLNGNYALEAGLSASKDAIAIETSDSAAAKTYANIIAVKEGNENSEGIKALVAVLKSDEIKKFINDTYQGSVVPFEE